MINIQLTGNWMAVGMMLNQLPVELAASAIWGQRKAAETLVKKVKKHLNSQDLGWIPRSSNYQSGDPRVLINEGDYYSAIHAWKEGMTYHAGVKSSAFNREGMRIVDYANMNEYGGGNLPARPLWQPSIEEMGGAAGIRGIVVAAIFAKVTRLRSAGFDVKLGTI